ncbi:hypothetical protein AWC38_SpisGene18039 [Stylophora pistillata]|uniref:Uncharacterized protein n=1 Tax=Stylophora pistillata TaxID=50429 RepID=A0A2B4RLE2_STYPI|nr:hypothetical protein AWC38_SpisGene18039 [Stylophora pistillata]
MLARDRGSVNLAQRGVKENRTATATESPPTRPVEQGGNDRKWALIGVFCGLVVVIVIIVGIAYWRSKKSHEKSPQDTFSQVGVVMKSHHLQSNVEHENGLENERAHYPELPSSTLTL